MHRETGTDFIRGLAIIGMVLSGTISRNAQLPSWLFHAQIPPPLFRFNPELPGISWVDLVFPFFLLAMGMAIPFALKPLVDKGVSQKAVWKKLLGRAFKLFFFAVMLGHLSPFHYPDPTAPIGYLSGVLAFAGFFLAFCRWPRHEKWLQASGYALLILLCVMKHLATPTGFSIHRNDIIILVLANMALFGGLIWYYTRKNWLVRLALVCVVFALRITSGVEGSWNQMIWSFTPFKWLGEQIPSLAQALAGMGIHTGKTIFYNSEFLKYLFVVIPGTIASDILLAGSGEEIPLDKRNGYFVWGIRVSVLVLIFANLVFLQYRFLLAAFVSNILLLGIILLLANQSHFLLEKKSRNILLWGAFWVLMGLVFESWEGGIKKDPSTWSYLLLTTGLGLLSFSAYRLGGFQKSSASRFTQWICDTGKNPMLAYVVITYLVIPLIWGLGLLQALDTWHTQFAWAGVIRGFLLTGIMVVLTLFTVRKKLFWKT